jgi:hypothetical protein
VKPEEEFIRHRDWVLNEFDPSDNGHILRKITRDRPDFPEDLRLWKQQIAEYLHLDPDQLDGTMHSLALIDKAQKKLKVKQKDFFKHLYPPLVGYIGEVIRLAVNGRWYMERAKDDPDIWEPTIIAADGQPISWWSQMYDFADEDYRHYSSVGAVLIATDRVTM